MFFLRTPSLNLRDLVRLTLVVCAAFLGCSEPLTPPSSQSPSEKIAASILDGSHGGNKHFFFLPPMVSASRVAAFTGVSDPDQAPSVVVCEWSQDQTGACGTIVAEFGRGDGSSPSDITYDPTEGEYKVDWKTTQCSSGPCTLDVSKTYRLRVLIGAYEVGHADLDVVSNGSALKNVETGEYIGLVEGRTLPIKFRIEKGAVSVVALGTSIKIGADGGVLATDDGTVSLDFTVGALNTEKAITIKRATEELPGVGAWAAAVDLGPDGTAFDKPVTLTLGFDGSKRPEGITPSAVAIYTWVGDSWEEVPGSTVNVTDNTVSAQISHFSEYVVSISPNYMVGRPDYSLFVGDQTQLTGYTVAYNVVATGRVCYQVRVQQRFLFWTRWVWRTYCYTVYTPYLWYPTGQRLYWYFVPRTGVADLPDCSSSSTCYTVIGASGNTNSPVVRAKAEGAASLGAGPSPPILVCVGKSCTPYRQWWAGTVNVVQPPVASVTLNTGGYAIFTGATAQLTATVKDVNGNVLTGRVVTWSSSDDKIATVDASGLVTGVNPGSAIVTATSEGKTATASIDVKRRQYVASGFDYTRGGEKSLAQGSYLAGFRASIARSYPDVEFAGSGTLSSASLAGVDLVVVSALRDNNYPVSPLTAEEQTALRGFVERGGCAMIFAENSEVASSSNPGVLNPFGLTIEGTLFGAQTATVKDPSASLVTSGPFGIIASFSQNFPGGITSAGPNGRILATNALGAALVVIPRGALGAGSGPVVIFSDATMLSSGPEGMYQSNEALLMNAFAFCRG